MRRIVFALAASLALAAQAQDWPSKSLRAIVPFPAGGGVDFVTRTVAQRLSEVLKQSVIVENRTGASGTIGADTLAKSAPDGYTFMVASPAEVLVAPIAGQKTPYDPERDLLPVTLIGETPLVLMANPSVQAKSLPELIDLAKSKPGTLSYATPGNGSAQHFAGEALSGIAGVELQHVPYRGAAPAVRDVIGGQVPLGISGMPPTVQHAKSGKLRIIAVTSAGRSGAMPDVAAVAETRGFSGYRFTNWMGLYVPAGTPAAVVERLATEVGKIVREPEIRAKLLAGGVDPIGNTPAEFRAFLESERAAYTKVAKERNVKVQQ
ncbi:MAG TPA: tripartite tricarboxylate transporter substrate binding protein [Usitatibacteraceae bacterium]|nr:tripartite tricarboxylate transporter substrate binding protein [Usitatibacteraceae bacterium]